MRRLPIGAPLLVLVGLVACGSDDDAGDAATEASRSGADDERTTVTTADDPTVPRAQDVTLTATVRVDGRVVAFDYTLTNNGGQAIAVVDTAAVAEQVDMVGEGAFRASWRRAEVYGEGGSPLPFLRGKVVPTDADLTGTATISGAWDELPTAVQLCIEVVPQPWTDKGDGVAEFPYRPRDTPPTVACTDQLDVPA